MYNSVVRCPSPDPGVGTRNELQNSVYNYMDTVNYQCSKDNDVVIARNLTIQCQSDGKWSDSPPVCGK